MTFSSNEKKSSIAEHQLRLALRLHHVVPLSMLGRLHTVCIHGASIIVIQRRFPRTLWKMYISVNWWNPGRCNAGLQQTTVYYINILRLSALIGSFPGEYLAPQKSQIAKIAKKSRVMVWHLTVRIYKFVRIYQIHHLNRCQTITLCRIPSSTYGIGAVHPAGERQRVMVWHRFRWWISKIYSVLTL